MSRLFFLLVIVVASASQTSRADFLGVTLGTRFAYQDMSLSCVRSGFPTIGLNVKGLIQQGHLYNGSISNSAETLYPKLVLTQEEMNGIELKKDAFGDYYITKLTLSPRMINYIFFFQTIGPAGLVGCKPLQALRTLSPYGAVFHFNPKTATIYLAPLQRFKGQLSDGSPFAAKLGFYQMQTDG